MSTDMPRDHVIRARLPWRDDDLTECGRPINDVATTITADQLKWRLKEHGQQRTAFTVCITCWTTCRDRSRDSWEANPASLLMRDMHRSAHGIIYFDYARSADGQNVRTGPHVDRLAAELHAIAKMIEAHRDEFDERVAAARDAALFTWRRGEVDRKKAGK